MQEALEPVSYPTHSYNFVLREPVGVCAGIIPWNFPLVMAVWKLAPALAMGNTCVLKPASNTPLTALKLAEILDETDLPKGVVNVITGGGATVGEELASQPGRRQGRLHRLDRGRAGGSCSSPPARSRRRTLELGGKSPNIVFEDADMDQAVDGALWATFFHQGQVCESGTRLLLPESIHDEFVERLVERAQADQGRRHAGLRDRPRPARLGGAARDGRELRADRQGGGREARARRQAARGRRFERGYWFEPTIFTEVDNSMTIAQEEIFGPVLSVIKFTTTTRRSRIANDSIYGLASGVWSQDPDRCLETREAPAGRHGLDQRLPPDQLRRAVRRLQAVGHRPRAGGLRPQRVHRGQARALGPGHAEGAEAVRRASLGVGWPALGAARARASRSSGSAASS